MKTDRILNVKYKVSHDDSEFLSVEFSKLIEMHLEFIEQNYPDISAKERVNFPGTGTVEWELEDPEGDFIDETAPNTENQAV